MRFEVQAHDAIKATFEAVSAGADVTGLSPTVRIQRLSDGMYWNDGGGAWQVGLPADATMVAVTNFPGLYEYAITPASLDHDLGLEGYRMRIEEPSQVALEYVHVVPRRQNLLEETWADFTGDATKLGHFLAHALNLAGKVYVREEPAAYDVDGRLTQIVLKSYPTAGDSATDTNMIDSITLDVSYDFGGSGSGLMDLLRGG